MSPAQRQATLREVLTLVPEASERFACTVLGWCRATLRYQARPRPRDARLTPVLPRLAHGCPRFGYRRIREVVCATVEPISRSAVQRLWQLLHLQVQPRKRRRRRRRLLAPVVGLRARHPQQVWCLDFLKDYTSDGRPLRFLSVVDEYTRECVALAVARRFTAADVVTVLRRLTWRHGGPQHVRSDNGPEFIASVVERWASVAGIQLVRSALASPWENPFSETFHSRLRDELVEREVFGSLEEAQVLAEVYRQWYNEVRPHSALRYLTPRGFMEKMRMVEGDSHLATTVA